MKLSFVIPAYNEELYIEKCLESINRELAGKGYDTEIIVVNNASSDRTGEIAESHPGVLVVDQPVKGLVHARQAGYTASTGELIANVDADAMLTPGWVERVLTEFSKSEKLVALSGPFIYYDSPKSVQRATKLFYRIGYLGYLMNRFVFRVGSMLQGGNFVVRRTALEKIGGFDTSISFYGEDTDIARRLHPVGDVKFTFKLPMFASGRRLMNEGVFTMGLRYAINHFWMTFFKRPFSERYTDIRLAQAADKPLAYRPQNRRREFAIIFSGFLLLFIVLGGMGLLIYKVNAGETPHQLALRMYRKFSDKDGDLREFNDRVETKLADFKNHIKTPASLKQPRAESVLN